MKINNMESQQASQDAPEKQLEANLEAFDPTGRARLESLGVVSQRLADASRVLNSMSDTSGEDIDELRSAVGNIDLACRELRTTVSSIDGLVRNIIREMVGIIQAIAINEANLFDLNTKTECLRQALTDKDLITLDDMKKAFEDTIRPMLQQHLAEKAIAYKKHS